MDIPRRIRELRELRGLSQEALARIIGVKGYQIRDLEIGKVWPSAFILASVVEHMGCDGTWLLVGRGTPYPDQPVATQGQRPVAQAMPGQLTVWTCEVCRERLAFGEETCPTCGRGLRWPARTGPGEGLPVDRAD